VLTRTERSTSPVAPAHCDTKEENDESLIALIGTGDREALSKLFMRFAVSIRTVGRRILRNDADADDLVQEVFLYINRKWDLFDRTKSSGRSWIFQIAYTQALLRRRRINSFSARVSGIADNLHEVEPRAFSGADYDQTVEGLFGRDGWQRVQEALTEDQRETLRLFFFEGYTFAEIAEKLGQSFFNVRHHYYRGLEKLRKNLTENVLNRR
jgi:RNA polymerase sigma-70 factor, ECF subfamily